MKVMISYQCETADKAQAVLSAVAAIGKEPHACSKQYVEPEEIKLTVDTKSVVARAMLDTVGLARPNVSPGEPSIGKIGTATKEYILEALKLSDRNPAVLSTKYTEHLKLLWSRGEVQFDGEAYYL